MCGGFDIPEGDCDCDGNVLDVCGECGGSGFAGCTNPAACNFDVAACVDDGSCLELDCNGVCGGDGVLDVCGICDGPGAVLECGCEDIPEGDCDCDGNVLDECGVCGGSGIPGGDCDCDGNVLTSVGCAVVTAQHVSVTMIPGSAMFYLHGCQMVYWNSAGMAQAGEDFWMAKRRNVVHL